MNSPYITKRSILLVISLTLIFSFGVTTVMASIFGKSELSGVWKERFHDVKKLNEYVQNNTKLEITDVSIKDYNLSNAKINNAMFRNIDWENATAEKISFSNTTFRGNKFNNIEFKNGSFENITFEDVEFSRAVFVGTQFKNVKFIRCIFKFRSAIVGLNNSTLDFDHSIFENANFSESQANITFRNSKLNDVEFTDLVFPSSITFENSKLQDIDLDRSKLTKLVMDNVTGGGRSGFAGGSIAEVEVRNNSAMGFNLMEGTIGKISFVNSEINVNFASSNIKEIQITNCKRMRDFGLYQAKIDVLSISNCPIDNLRPLETIIQNFSIDHASIVNSDFGDMKVKNLTLTDVSFDQKIDFTGAQVEHLLTKNVTKLPGLNLNLTGSNVKF